MEVYEEIGLFFVCLVSLCLLLSFGYCAFAIDRANKDKLKRMGKKKKNVLSTSPKPGSSSGSLSEIVIIDPNYAKSKSNPETKAKTSSEVVAEVHSTESNLDDPNYKSSSLLKRTATTRSLNNQSQKKLNRIEETTGSLKNEPFSDNLSKVNQETLSHYEEYKSVTKIEDLRAKSSSNRSSLRSSQDLPKEDKISLSHYEEYKGTTKTEELRTKDSSSEHSIEPSNEPSKEPSNEPSDEPSSEGQSWLEKLTNDNKYGMHPPLDLTNTLNQPSTLSE